MPGLFDGLFALRDAAPHADEIVLITGITGYLGTEVALAFLEAGYRVRGVVRKLDQSTEWQAKHGMFDFRMEWFIVPDITVPKALDRAAVNVAYIIHLASPLKFDATDPVKQILQPAILGTLNALKAAEKTPSVKRVVITSSMAAVLDFSNLSVQVTYDDEDWNPVTYQEAKKAKGEMVYVTSKALAEPSAWDFMEKHKPHFSLTTNCAGFVFGPPRNAVKSMSHLSASVAAIWACIDAKEVPRCPFPVWVDVRDLALIHLRSATLPIAANQRYVCVSKDRYDFGMIIEIIRKHFPKLAHRLPSTAGYVAPSHYGVNSLKVQKHLGVEFRSLEESVVYTCKVLFELVAESKK